MRAFGGMGKTKKIVINPPFLSRKPFDVFIDRIYPAVSCVKMK